MVETADYADGITKTALVIDNGSGVIKAGFGGEEQPSLLFNAYVGRPKYDKVMVATTSDQNIFIGEQTEKFRGVLKINYPIKHGIITDWKDMELLWRHVYEKLNVSPKEHPVLLTEAPLNPYQNRVRAAEIFFETFDVPSLFFQTQAVLSLYA
jgi:centractin